MSMATDSEIKSEEICRELDKLNGPPQWPTMRKEEIRHGLGPRAINDLLKRSVAEELLDEGERERNEDGEVARLRDEISTLGKKLSDKATTLRLTRIGLFIAAAGLAIDLLFR